jgi:hypothetical protein
LKQILFWGEFGAFGDPSGDVIKLICKEIDGNNKFEKVKRTSCKSPKLH